MKSEFRHPKFKTAVDYAFFCDSSVDKPVLLLEAKTLGRSLNDGKIINQLCSYMGQIGVQWGALTDGNKYVMYNSNAGVSFEEQKFLTLQTRTADTEDGIPSERLAEELIAILGRDSLKNDGIQKFYEEHAINSKLYPNPSNASRALLYGRSGGSGWDLWDYKDEHGEWHRVKMLREQYRKRHGLRAIHQKKAP